MSESDKPETTTEDAAPQGDGAPAEDQLPEEWKPEPREWTWKDLFTAPMLAFKPKCMLISVITVALIGGFAWLWFDKLLTPWINDEGERTGAGTIPVLAPALTWLGYGFTAVIFGLGATLVSVFMKADLLDDEFLSLKEALGQFKGRFLAAIMVPLFLVGVLGGFKLLIYLGELLCSIPYAGSALYAIFYPIAFLLALFTVLLSIGVLLSVFVGPAVVSIRKHGWFDNVIDTFEAVGTKPHVLVANLALTWIMVLVCYGIGHGAIGLLAEQARSDNLPGTEMAKVEARSNGITSKLLPYYDVIAYQAGSLPGTGLVPRTGGGGGKVGEGYYDWFTGLVGGGWKVLITALISGYVVNVFLAGGMLTYLAVREDDYWDDEDLEDLDQLAKELEEEAKREEAAAAEAAGDDKPVDEDKPAEDAKGDDKPADDAETVVADEDKGGGDESTDDDEDKSEGEGEGKKDA